MIVSSLLWCVSLRNQTCFFSPASIDSNRTLLSVIKSKWSKDWKVGSKVQGWPCTIRENAFHQQDPGTHFNASKSACLGKLQLQCKNVRRLDFRCDVFNTITPPGTYTVVHGDRDRRTQYNNSGTPNQEVMKYSDLNTLKLPFGIIFWGHFPNFFCCGTGDVLSENWLRKEG